MIKNRYRTRLSKGEQPHGTAPRTSCASDIRHKLQARLADHMRVMNASGISVTVETLKGETGMSAALIARLAPGAAARARRASTRRVEA